MFQLLQPGQHQRLDQQLKIGRAVRGVVDDAGQLALAHAVRCGADRQGGQQAAERQPKRPLAKNVGDGQDRRPCDELSDHFELDRLQRVQPPAGAIPVTLRARPRRSSSNATQPPNELPTIWLVSQPSSSSWRSTWSASTAEDKTGCPRPVRRCGRPSWGQIPRSGRCRPAAGRPSPTPFGTSRTGVAVGPALPNPRVSDCA